MTLQLLELTPPGRGGVSVLALRGPGALARAREFLPETRIAAGSLTFARLTLGGRAADEVLVCASSEDEVELHLHGSPALLGELSRALGAERVRRSGSSALAAPAETETQEELAARLLCDASGESAARILLDQAEGALARELDALVHFDDRGLAAGLAELLVRSRSARYAIEPRTVVLAGPVNAGKSTLFNVLAGARHATVSAEEGTTRDALCERVLVGRYPVDLVDTAGERTLAAEGAREEIERAAQGLAREWSARADLALWLQPPGAPEPPPLRPGALPRVVLPSLADLRPGGGGICALRDPEGAQRKVESIFLAVLSLPPDPWHPGRGVVLGAPLHGALRQILADPPGDRRRRLAAILGREPGRECWAG